MNSLDWLSTFNVFASSFCLRLVLTFVHFIWQGCVVVPFVFGVSWLLRTTSARIRYLVNVAALLLMVACLPVTFALVTVPPPDAPAAIAETSEQAPEDNAANLLRMMAGVVSPKREGE